MTSTNLTILIILLLSSTACVLDDDNGGSSRDCSVSARCSGKPDARIRLRQVETHYFEQQDDSDSVFSDIAQFDYNSLNQWSGGVTRRAAESDFDYLVEYDAQGRMSDTLRTYYDDLGNEAEVSISYSYNSNQLSESLSVTEIRNDQGALIKTISEDITYTFVNNKLDRIGFDVDDSEDGIYSFDYEFSYTGSNDIKEILITNQSSGKDNFVFKSFTYKNNRVDTSKTFKLSPANVQSQHESIEYQYYEDGPLKQKISILNTQPKQKVITVYKWEEGGCATNQTFGDRLFPTPEVPNFPCL